MDPVPGGMGGGGGVGGGQMVGNQFVMECEKGIVGRIIGRGGETINMLQGKSGAKIQIDQSIIPCKIMISGQPQNIAMASPLAAA
jgi:far upstream element-binding protein